MMVAVPLYAFGPMGHALHDADVGAALIEMIGEGYRFEFTAPKDGEKFRAALAKLGVRVLDIPRDTATGAQAGTRPKA
jgi:hypothetical protein